MKRSERMNALQSPLVLGALSALFLACGSSQGARLSQAIDAPESLSSAALDHADSGGSELEIPCDVISDCEDNNPCTKALCLDGFCYTLPTEDPSCCQSGISALYAFEPEGSQGLALGEPGEGEAWVLSAERALSPPTSLHFGDPNEGRMNGFEPVKGSIELPPMLIPFDADAELRLWLFADIEAAPTRDDFNIVISATTPEGIALPPLRLMNKGAMPSAIYEGFTKVKLPLSDFAGYSIRVSFHFDSVIAPNPSKRGIFIDDLELETGCQESFNSAEGASEGSTPLGESALDDATREGPLGRGTPSPDDEERGRGPSSLQEGGDSPDEAPDAPSSSSPPQAAAPSSGDDSEASGNTFSEASASPSSSSDSSSGSSDSSSGSSDSSSGSSDSSSGSSDSSSGSSDSSSGSSDSSSGSSESSSSEEVTESSGSLVSGDQPADPCAALDAHANCCTSDADCDDGNPATINVCEGAECVASWAPSGCLSDLECSDGESCTLDRCEQGQCVHEGVFGQDCCMPASTSIASFDAQSLEGIFVTDNLETGAFWRPDSTRSTSGDFSLYCGDPFAQTFGIGERVKSSATTPMLAIPAGGQTRLDFDLFMVTRAHPHLDVFQVFILREGVLEPLWSSKVFTTGNTMGFLPVSVDLSLYAGKNVQLRFVFDSVDGHASELEGTYIDSLRLETTCD